MSLFVISRQQRYNHTHETETSSSDMLYIETRNSAVITQRTHIILIHCIALFGSFYAALSMRPHCVTHGLSLCPLRVIGLLEIGKP